MVVDVDVCCFFFVDDDDDDDFRRKRFYIVGTNGTLALYER